MSVAPLGCLPRDAREKGLCVMPIVQDILLTKGRAIVSTTPNATVFDAVNKMNQHKLGALVVMQGDQVAGIFTERDVLRRVLGEDRNPKATFVGEVMTTDVYCCAPDTELDEVSTVMQE